MRFPRTPTVLAPPGAGARSDAPMPGGASTHRRSGERRAGAGSGGGRLRRWWRWGRSATGLGRGDWLASGRARSGGSSVGAATSRGRSGGRNDRSGAPDNLVGQAFLPDLRRGRRKPVPAARDRQECLPHKTSGSPLRCEPGLVSRVVCSCAYRSLKRSRRSRRVGQRRRVFACRKVAANAMWRAPHCVARAEARQHFVPRGTNAGSEEMNVPRGHSFAR